MRPKVLGIDYGTKRIGLAVASPLGTVHPRPRLDRTAPAADLRALAELADEEDVASIVIGLPHHMDGAKSEMEIAARAFAAQLAEATGLPVFGTDERLSSQVADSMLAERTRDPRKRKERVDSAAACLLLTDYLAAEEKAERIA
ncbi:MAG: Holliday junction resolvase RuvX [Planctomycetota bacterium]